jgi:hypothetical protein
MINVQFGVEDDIVDKIVELRKNEISYVDILQQVNISKDQLKRICRVYELNKPPVNTNTKLFDKDEVLKYYKTVTSLRKTALYFNTTRDTIRKHIDDNEIIRKKQNKKSRSQCVIDWRKRKKIELVKYKGGKCERCGYDKCMDALSFHHLDPSQKDFGISRKSYSIERLKKEVDKCILVCSNCHIELHYINKNGNVAPM